MAGESILAGCGQSMPCVRCYLYDVLERAHYRVPEGLGDSPMVRVPVRSYVDDITQFLQGTP
eukprot:5405462-Pyramimonas_sp.AAC.1